MGIILEAQVHVFHFFSLLCILFKNLFQILVIFKSYCVGSIGVRDHFRWGGHKKCCPNFSSLPEKSHMFGQCILPHLGGGGV